jgi:site-specific DNA-methyltransferase (adenine-specific)
MKRLLTNECRMDFMSRYPDKFFDLAILDPEYGIGASKPSKKSSKVKQSNGTVLNVDMPDYGSKDWDDRPPPPEYFDEVYRVSKRQIIFGANYFGLKGGILIWDKLNAGSDQYDAEIAWLSWTKSVRTVYYMWHGMMQGFVCSSNINLAFRQQGNKELNEKRIHPTQKPVKLYEWMLREYAKEGDLIMDAGLGSGSSVIACDNLGFDIYGCENDTEEYDKMQKRLYQHDRSKQHSLY